MPIKNQKYLNWTFNEIALNLHGSSRHIKIGEATIVQDIDFDDNSGALTGRYGTKTINVNGATPDPLAANEFHDLFRATDTDTDKKYLIGVYEDGANYKIGALCTTDGDKAYTTLQQSGSDFALSKNRISFANYREPGIDDVIVAGTNGVDQPFYFKGNGVVTNFQFGTSDFRLKFLLERPWKGHAWAALRDGEETTIHWSEATNFLSYVDNEGSGFRQCPQDDLLNAFRGFRIFNDKLTVFNLDSIGELFATGNTAAPFRFRELKRGHGAVHNGAIAYQGDAIWFLDKRAPYLKFWDGYNVIDNYASADTIATGFEKWLDLDDLLNVRMTTTAKKLYISFKASTTYATTGADGNRWLAVISLDKLDRNNLPYHPMSLWKIRCNDIIVADEGTDFGQVYYLDAAPQTLSGTPYYFTRRIADWYDVRDDVANAFGDGNGITGVDASDVANILQTGWFKYPGNTWFRALIASVDAEWEGTPSTGTTFSIKYRFDGWNSFATLIVSSVDGVKRYPFAGNAQGRRMQLKFEYTDNQSRPILHGLEMWMQIRAGVQD